MATLRKNRYIFLIIAIAIFLFMGVLNVNVTTIGFDDLETPGAGSTQFSGPYTDQGYTIGADIGLGYRHQGTQLFSTSAALGNAVVDGTIRLETRDGALFDLYS